MSRYVYAWTVRPTSSVEIELRIRAATAAQAQRELRRFLATRLDGDWSVCAVARSPEPDVPPFSLEAGLATACRALSPGAEGSDRSL